MSLMENPYVRVDGTDVRIDELALSSLVPSERVTRTTKSPSYLFSSAHRG